MNYALNPDQVQRMATAMQNHRVDTKAKQVPPLRHVLQARKSQMYTGFNNNNNMNMENMGQMSMNQGY